ncbi:MAG: hypothetical protein ACREHV_08560 [Rhizomicrobium sp.]
MSPYSRSNAIPRAVAFGIVYFATNDLVLATQFYSVLAASFEDARAKIVERVQRSFPANSAVAQIYAARDVVVAEVRWPVTIDHPPQRKRGK